MGDPGRQFGGRDMPWPTEGGPAACGGEREGRNVRVSRAGGAVGAGETVNQQDRKKEK